MSAGPEFLAAFDALPLGAYGGTYDRRRWRIAKTQMSNGRSQKLEAEELGGNDTISCNLFRLATGEALLKPCEMPEAKVIAFVTGVVAD